MSKARAVGAALGRMMGLMGRGSGPSRELTLDDWRDMCGEAMAAALKFQARVLELEREVAELKAQVARAGQPDGLQTIVCVAPNEQEARTVRDLLQSETKRAYHDGHDDAEHRVKEALGIA